MAKEITQDIGFSGFLKNNAVVNSNSIVGYQNDGDYDFGYTQTIVIELAANDTVKVYGRSAGAYNGEVYRANCFLRPSSKLEGGNNARYNSKPYRTQKTKA